MTLYVAGMKLQTKLILMPLTALIVGLKQVFDVALEDLYLWITLFVLICIDAFIAIVIAIWRREFDWKRLDGFIIRIGVFCGGSVLLSFITAGYAGRVGSSGTAEFIRDFVIYGLSIYMFGRIMNKARGEGKVFWKVMSEAMEKMPFNGNGRPKRFQNGRHDHEGMSE